MKNIVILQAEKNIRDLLEARYYESWIKKQKSRKVIENILKRGIIKI